MSGKGEGKWITLVSGSSVRLVNSGMSIGKILENSRQKKKEESRVFAFLQPEE